MSGETRTNTQTHFVTPTYKHAVMFNIAMDESGATCNSHELVKDKSESDVGNAKKRKYFCVTCQDGKHPVFLKIRHKIQKLNTKARNYKSAAWFSHHGKSCEGENSGESKRDNPSPETALHWQAKHILCKDVGRYSYVTSRCTGCGQAHVENGAGACARVEHVEKKADGNHYRFDAVLMRGDTVSSVMEVWATHETGELKREYCLDMGFTFSEFDARHVIDAHDSAPEGSKYKLQNLKIRLFECPECVHQKAQIELAQENKRLAAVAMAEAARIRANKFAMVEAARIQANKVAMVEAARIRANKVAMVEAARILTYNIAIDQSVGKKDPHQSSGVVLGVPIPNTLPYDPLTHAARLRVHLDECTKCIVWCIKAGPQYHPASENRQKAPCNVGNFYFGQPPWLTDGSVNPLGVPP